MQLGPYFLPKGTGVHINLWAMQHDERYWKDPEAFKPERWIGDKTGGDMSNGMAYMPFGMGPRMCIGIKLARKSHVQCLSRCCPMMLKALLCMQLSASHKVQSDPAAGQCCLLVCSLRDVYMHFYAGLLLELQIPVAFQLWV